VLVPFVEPRVLLDAVAVLEDQLASDVDGIDLEACGDIHNPAAADTSLQAALHTAYQGTPDQVGNLEDQIAD